MRPSCWWPRSADQFEASGRSIDCHRQDALELMFVIRLRAGFSQRRIRICFAKARCWSKLAVSAGFHAGGGSVCLATLRLQFVAIVNGLDAGETISVFANKHILCSRARRLEPELAPRIGRSRVGLGGRRRG